MINCNEDVIDIITESLSGQIQGYGDFSLVCWFC